jgi:hypothetical protein
VKIQILRVQLSGSESCTTPDGVTHTGPGCCGAAARHLISHGTSPNVRLRFMRGDRVSLSGTVDAFARQSWAGSDKDPGMRKWRPDPRFPLPPKLASWWKEISQ